MTTSRERRRGSAIGSPTGRRSPAAEPWPLTLQRTAGNAATAALVRGGLPVQRLKLSNGKDTDTYAPDKLVSLYLQLAMGGSGSKAKLGKPSAKASLAKPMAGKAPKKKGSALKPKDLEVLRAAIRKRLNSQRTIAAVDDDTLEAMEEIANAKIAYQGKGLQTVDSTYYDKPPDLRPDKGGAALFQAVYVAPAKKTVVNGTSVLARGCEEPGCPLGGTVHFAPSKPYKEFDPSTGAYLAKAPPICHKTPYAVMVKALLQVVTSSEWTRAIQPGSAAWSDVHYALAWGDAANLGPGHAACNSRTASTGKRQPTAAEVKQVRTWAKQTSVNGVPVVQ